jgi:hypothetical protein
MPAGFSKGLALPNPSIIYRVSPVSLGFPIHLFHGSGPF